MMARFSASAAPAVITGSGAYCQPLCAPSMHPMHPAVCSLIPHMDTALHCGAFTARTCRYIGKKKCYTCGVPVLMCVPCMTEKIDTVSGRELEVRCPLCKEEQITVPASETMLTDNGIGAVNLDVGKDRQHVSRHCCPLASPRLRLMLSPKPSA